MCSRPPHHTGVCLLLACSIRCAASLTGSRAVCCGCCSLCVCRPPCLLWCVLSKSCSLTAAPAWLGVGAASPFHRVCWHACGSASCVAALTQRTKCVVCWLLYDGGCAYSLFVHKLPVIEGVDCCASSCNGSQPELIVSAHCVKCVDHPSHLLGLCAAQVCCICGTCST